jgi:S-DNA-T family DNA segregation ATPase FtsK/SpoIIIE
MGKKSFYIARIEVDKKEKNIEEVKKTEEKKYKPEHFVSSFHGKKVKDVPTFPYIKYGNKGSQYEGLRDKRLVSDSELEQTYGTKYYEFTQIQGVKPRSLEEDEGDDKENQFLKKQYEQDNIKEYTAEEEYINDTEELGRLRDLPAEEEFDFTGSVYSSKDYKEKEIEVKSINEYQANPRPIENPNKTVDGYDTSRIKVAFQKKKKTSKYVAPPISLLKRGQTIQKSDYSSVNYQKEVIDRTLRDFRIGGRVVHYTKGPAVTQFEIKLDAGVKVEKVKNIQRNLQMNLEGKSIRIEAPIPGKSTVGIEVPNIVQDKVLLGEMLSRPEFLNDGNPLNAALGVDIAGNFVDLDITEMPHALVAGTTGSGKSVCINSILTSIIYKASPDDVRLILIDPKLIEFTAYEDIPHLATPVINDPKLATVALKWAVDEMQNRYELFKACKRRDITSYNQYAEENGLSKIPYIVIVIDELADLMFIAASSVEEYIQRLAQKARAAGIHLIMATQRPSTDVIKGTIKANMQTRIAFAVNSQVDSMTILDRAGADKLLGKGDMLYFDGVNEIRVQGAYVSLEEILAVTDYVKENYEPNFMFSKEELTSKMEREERMDEDGRYDEYFSIIARFVVENDSASINRIQKEFGIGFNRAQNIMNALESLGIVSEGVAGKQRSVLITIDELDDRLEF